MYDDMTSKSDELDKDPWDERDAYLNDLEGEALEPLKIEVLVDEDEGEEV